MQLNHEFYLRPVSPFDYMDIFKILQSTVVTKYLNFMPINNLFLTKKLVSELYLHHLKKYPLTMAIVHKNSGSVIGIIGFYKYRQSNKSVEIEFYIDEEFMKKNIMTKALELMLTYAFKSLKVKRIYLSHTKENTACKKLTVKFNFTFDYIEKNFMVKSGYKTDIYHYYLDN